MDVIKNMKCENCQRKSHRCKRENLRVDNFSDAVPWREKVLSPSCPGEQIGLAGLASPCHLSKGAKDTAKMSESSSEDLNDVKLSSHEGNWVPSMGEKSRRSDEGNRVPLRCPLRKSKGSGAGRGTTFPRTPLSTASWMQRAWGKTSVACSIRNLVKFL